MDEQQPTRTQKCLERIVKRTAHLSLASQVDTDHASEVLVATNRLAASLGTDRAPSEAAALEVQRLVEAVLTVGESEQLGDYVTECIRDINAIASTIRIWDASGHGRNKPHRKDSEVDYLVRSFDGRLFLVEKRSNRDDMRVPQPDYLAAIQAFSTEPQPSLKFNDLVARFEENGGQAVPSKYPLRVVLRFWRSLAPPLVVRENARYRYTPCDFAEFQKLAMSAWSEASGGELVMAFEGGRMQTTQQA